MGAGFKSSDRILIVHTAFLGDILLMVPLLKWLRHRYSGATIELVTRPGIAGILKKTGIIDSLYEVNKGDRHAYQALASDLQKFRFLKIICPHPSIRSALFVSRLNAEKKIGFRSWWNFLFFHIRVEKRKDLPEPLRLLELLSEPDLQPIETLQTLKTIDWFEMKGHSLPSVPTAFSLNSRDQIIARVPGQPWISQQSFVVFFPGSQWQTKRWKEIGFVEVGQKLSSQFQVYWCGAPNERELCEKIASKVPGSVSLAGRLSIEQTYRLLTEAKLVIANDNGGAHMAAFAGAPVLSIFGPTVIKQGFRPWSDRGNFIAEIKDLHCRPCGAHGHNHCPLNTHACMRDLSSAAVLKVIEQASIGYSLSR